MHRFGPQRCVLNPTYIGASDVASQNGAFLSQLTAFRKKNDGRDFIVVINDLGSKYSRKKKNKQTYIFLNFEWLTQ
jgi:hypothetical protein